jgi:hypothetical protein
VTQFGVPGRDWAQLGLWSKEMQAWIAAVGMGAAIARDCLTAGLSTSLVVLSVVHIVACVELRRMSKAVKCFGIGPMALRQWALDGKIPDMWVGRERRFSSVDVENMKCGSDCSTFRAWLELLSARVSGSSGRESSLEAREQQLRVTSTGKIVKVVRDRGSGLKENRPGLNGGGWRWCRTVW